MMAGRGVVRGGGQDCALRAQASDSMWSVWVRRSILFSATHHGSPSLARGRAATAWRDGRTLGDNFCV